MKIRTEVLSGDALDWAVRHAAAEQSDIETITQSAGISIVRCNDLYFPKGNEHGDHYEPYYRGVSPDGVKMYGPSPAIATKRVYVKTKLGDVVEIPDNLT
jgi:hypothetical protein